MEVSGITPERAHNHGIVIIVSQSAVQELGGGMWIFVVSCILWIIAIFMAKVDAEVRNAVFNAARLGKLRKLKVNKFKDFKFLNKYCNQNANFDCLS